MLENLGATRRLDLIASSFGGEKKFIRREKKGLKKNETFLTAIVEIFTLWSRPSYEISRRGIDFIREGISHDSLSLHLVSIGLRDDGIFSGLTTKTGEMVEKDETPVQLELMRDIVSQPYFFSFFLSVDLTFFLPVDFVTGGHLSAGAH